MEKTGYNHPVTLMKVALIGGSLQEQGLVRKIHMNIKLAIFSHLFWGEFPPQAQIQTHGAALEHWLGVHGLPAPLWERGL